MLRHLNELGQHVVALCTVPGQLIVSVALEDVGTGTQKLSHDV